MGHERSVTFKVGGKWYNHPSIIDGKQYDEDAVREYAKKHKTLGTPYNTVDEAVNAARKRSQSFDRKHR